MSDSDKRDRTGKKRAKPVWLKIAAVVAVLGMAYWLWPTRGDGGYSGATFTAQRGPLEVTVLEGGTIEALESQEIKSEVQGETRILNIVEEGYFVTAEDVANGKVLVELDASRLLEQQTQQELQYQNALAGLTESREQLEIQINQNASDITAAELASKFALMDMSKYLGERVSLEIAEKLESTIEFLLDPVQAAGEQELLPLNGRPADDMGEDSVIAPFPGSDEEPLEVMPIPMPDIDYTQYADPEILGDGQARQLLRERENSLTLAMEEVGLAQTQLEGTRRLYEKDFVTKNDLENDEMRLKRQRINVEAAETEQDIFIRYEFPKEAERLVSDYVESLRKLERAKKLAVSRLAQVRAKLRSAEAQYNLQRQKRQEIADQIEACTIRAERSGLVIYGSSASGSMRDTNLIEEGAGVRERQVIIVIPDTSRMAVNVKVHESSVNKLSTGMRARVTLDAFPEDVLSGEVVRIAVLPDAQNRWLNPDLKVYTTKVAIDGTYDWVKPGVTAQAEIIVEQLDDVVYVPIQAIQVQGRQRFLHVGSLTGSEMRPVVTGLHNDAFIEIREGIEPGETVLLRAPVSRRDGESEDRDEPRDEEAPDQPVAAV